MYWKILQWTLVCTILLISTTRRHNNNNNNGFVHSLEIVQVQGAQQNERQQQEIVDTSLFESCPGRFVNEYTQCILNQNQNSLIYTTSTNTNDEVCDSCQSCDTDPSDGVPRHIIRAPNTCYDIYLIFCPLVVCCTNCQIHSLNWYQCSANLLSTRYFDETCNLLNNCIEYEKQRSIYQRMSNPHCPVSTTDDNNNDDDGDDYYDDGMSDDDDGGGNYTISPGPTSVPIQAPTALPILSRPQPVRSPVQKPTLSSSNNKNVVDKPEPTTIVPVTTETPTVFVVEKDYNTTTTDPETTFSAVESNSLRSSATPFLLVHHHSSTTTSIWFVSILFSVFVVVCIP